MEIKRANDRPTKVAPEDKFTGQVWQDEVLVGTAPSRMRATNVSFSPGARTAWHAHPVGQTLYSSPASAGCSSKASRCRSSIRATPR